MTAVIIIYIYAALLAFACALDVVGLESATKYEHSGRFLFKLQCIGAGDKPPSHLQAGCCLPMHLQSESEVAALLIAKCIGCCICCCLPSKFCKQSNNILLPI